MFKKLLVGLAVLVVALVAVVSLQPSSFRVERSLVVAAPADVVFPLVNDFRHFDRFSPWSKLDPNMKKTFDGPASGVGASYAWEGNDDVGAGRMTIVESRTNERVDVKLEFLKPFASTSKTWFVLAPEGEGTKVTWAMAGENDFMGKAFGLMVDVEAMIGADYDKGLKKLAKVAEEEVTARAETEKEELEAAAAAALSDEPAVEAAVEPAR